MAESNHNETPQLAAFTMSRRYLHPDDGNTGGGGTPPAGAAAAGTVPPAAAPAAAGAAAGDPPGTPPAGGRVTFTPAQQEEVNRIAAEARNQGRRAATTATPAAPAATPSLQDLQDRLDASEQRRVFDKHALRLGLNDEQAEELFPMFRGAKPEDAGAWFARISKTFGLGQTTQNTSTAAAAATQQVVTPNPLVAPNAPAGVNPLDAGGLVDIYTMNDVDRARLGPAGLRAQHEKIMAEANARSGAPPMPRALRPQQPR